MASPKVEQFPSGTKFPGDQYRYGPRVPCIVAGPYATPKTVSHEQFSRVSLVAYGQAPNPKPAPGAPAGVTS